MKSYPAPAPVFALDAHELVPGSPARGPLLYAHGTRERERAGERERAREIDMYVCMLHTNTHTQRDLVFGAGSISARER